MPIPTDLKRRHRETLDRVFNPPRKSNPGIRFEEMLALLEALGATVNRSGEGSRYRITLASGSTGVLHRPHKGRPLDGGATAYVREWLRANGIFPDPPAES